MKPKPPASETAPPPEKKPIVFKVNIIAPVADALGGSRFISAGEPSPYDDISEVPDHLRAFIASDKAESEPNESNARFELGVTYQLNSDGRRGRAIGRQVAELESEAEQQAWAEEQLSESLRPDIADALEDQYSARWPPSSRSSDPGKMARYGERNRPRR